MKRTVWCQLLCAAALVCWGAVTASATVLTMDGDVSSTNNAAPPPAGGNSYVLLGNGSTIVSEYGDYVSGPTQSDVPTVDFGSPPYWYNFRYGNNGEGYTPNINVGKQIIYQGGSGPITSTATRSWSAAGGGTLLKIAYPAASTTVGGKWYWTFTADPGYQAKLISFDMGLFVSSAPNVDVNIYSGNNPSSLGPLLYSAGSVAVPFTGTTIPLNNTMGNQLTLEVTLPPGPSMSNSYIIDNIVFAQVPEPASLALVAMSSVLGLAASSRRRRS
jgi:PEP-CTERM motif